MALGPSRDIPGAFCLEIPGPTWPRTHPRISQPTHHNQTHDPHKTLIRNSICGKIHIPIWPDVGLDCTPQLTPPPPSSTQLRQDSPSPLQLRPAQPSSTGPSRYFQKCARPGLGGHTLKSVSAQTTHGRTHIWKGYSGWSWAVRGGVEGSWGNLDGAGWCWVELGGHVGRESPSKRRRECRDLGLKPTEVDPRRLCASAEGRISMQLEHL